MSCLNYLNPIFVDFIPETLEQGIIYISWRYSTAAHLCCCGCGREVITPLNPAKWQLTEVEGDVSLHPSVGNWSFPCQSHYWIRNSRIFWAGAISPEMIVAVKLRDQQDVEALTPKSVWKRFGQWLSRELSKFRRLLRK